MNDEKRLSFTIIGGNSAGQGWFDFCQFDLYKNFKLMEKPKAFILFNFLILLCLEKSYQTCRIDNVLIFCTSQILNIGGKEKMNEEDLKKSLSFLKRRKYISYEKPDRGVFVITIL